MLLKRAESLEAVLAKAANIKQLIAELNREMDGLFAPTRKKHKKHKKHKKAERLEYGADLPDEMSIAERKVLAALQHAQLAPGALATATKLTPQAVGHATRRLKQRKLILALGETKNTRVWKVK